MGLGPNTMNFRRLLRGPAVWVLLIVIIALFALQIGQIGKGYQRIETSAALALIAEGKVEMVTLVNGDQRMDLDLKKGQTYSGKGVRDADRVQAFYVDPLGPTVTEAVLAANSDKKITSYDAKVPKTMKELIMPQLPGIPLLSLSAPSSSHCSKRQAWMIACG